MFSRPYIVSVNLGRISFGLHKCFDVKPNIKPPKPKPHITNPETTPFLPGKWVIADYNAVEYIIPLPIPKEIPYE